jgi:hypothetical protein
MQQRGRTGEVEHVREGVEHAQAALVVLAQQVARDAARQARAGAQEARDRHVIARLVLADRVQHLAVRLRAQKEP